MAPVLKDKFLVDMHWEPLLGLERESREVSRLLKRREANAHVVTETTQLDRILGSSHVVLEADAPPPTLYAFAAALAEVVEHARFLFSHMFADGDALAGHVLLIGVRDKRIDLDKVVPVEQVHDVAESFLRLNVADGVAILGPEGQAGVTYPYTLEDAFSALEERDLSAHAVQIKRTLDKRIVRAVVAGGVVLGLGVVAMLAWPDPSPPTPVVGKTSVVDHAAVFRSAWQDKLRVQTEKGGPAYAQFVFDTLRALPVDKNGWRLRSAACTPDDCTLTRNRGAGADTKALLDGDAVVTFDENLEIAKQRIAVPESSDQTNAPRPIANGVFQESVVSRFQALADYGLSPRITAAEPLVQTPAELTDPEPPPRSGTWEISGDLAFLDSIVLLTIRSQNMAWRSLNVALDDATLTFVAKGVYFVF